MTIVFDVGGTWLGLPAAAVREVLFMPNLSRPPGLPAVVEGFLDLRTEMVPVVRLDRLLELPESRPALYTPLLVLHEPRCALMAHALDDLPRSLESQPLAGPLPAGLSGCVAAQAGLGGRIVYLLAPDRLLHAAEARTLAELAEAEGRRRLLWQSGVGESS